MTAGVDRCPVCRAGFREAAFCSRCGADLAPLMVLTAQAHRMRCQARAALLRAEYAEALSLARRAEELRSSLVGRKLLMLSRGLALRG